MLGGQARERISLIALEGIGSLVLLEEVYNWRVHFEDSKSHPKPSFSLFPFLLPVARDAELPAIFLVLFTGCLAPHHDDDGL